MNNEVFIPKELVERAASLTKRAEEIVGYDPNTPSRKRVYVYPRMMVAYLLLCEGYSEHQVGKTLGRDHATINYYRRRMGDVLESPGYDQERKIFNQLRYDRRTIQIALHLGEKL